MGFLLMLLLAPLLWIPVAAALLPAALDALLFERLRGCILCRCCFGAECWQHIEPVVHCDGCRACGLVGCLPEEALHVGDSLIADVGGALQAGLAGAIWINRGGARQLPEGMQAAAVLSSVLELPSALRELQVLPPE
jgi:hypothetical protein